MIKLTLFCYLSYFFLALLNFWVLSSLCLDRLYLVVNRLSPDMVGSDLIFPVITNSGRRKTMAAEQSGPLAVSGSEVEQWGCPYCGYRSGYSWASGGGASIFVCGECEKGFVILAEGVTRSSFGFGDGFHPELSVHPRAGIPSHNSSDKRPEGGGEFFNSRGIGLDNCTCFICGTRDRDGKGHVALNNIAAFVQCKEAGERVVAMFLRGARLDYREYEPDRVQVKIGACDRHKPNLKDLDKLTSDGIITQDRISLAMV